MPYWYISYQIPTPALTIQQAIWYEGKENRPKYQQNTTGGGSGSRRRSLHNFLAFVVVVGSVSLCCILRIISVTAFGVGKCLRISFFLLVSHCSEDPKPDLAGVI